jgi:hypothetical protein
MARELVTVARFDIPAKAHIALNALEEEGIRCVIQDEQLVAMDYLLNLAVGGIKVQVWDEDAERAVALLEGLEPPRETDREDSDETGGDDERKVPLDREEPAGRIEQTGPGAARSDLLADDTRDRYARRAILSALGSILMAPLAFVTAYFLLMTAFTEGRLSTGRWIGVVLAAIPTLFLMLLSPIWVFMMFRLIAGD